MSRKHFKALADVVKNTDLEPEAKERLAHEIALVCRSFNPNFDLQRFLTACGVE